MNQRRALFLIGGLVLGLTLMALGYLVLAPESVAQGATTIHIGPPEASVEGPESLAPDHAPVVSRTVELEPFRMQRTKSIAVEARSLHTGYPPSALKVERYPAARPWQLEIATERAVRHAIAEIPFAPVQHSGGATTRPAAVCVVNSTADGGAGTLRRCLQNAVPGDTITFNATVFSSASPVTISLSSALPYIITNSLTIDASNAGVILSGSGLSSGDGLVILGASGVKIRGLQIMYFPRHGVAIANGARNTIIGGDRLIGSGPLGQGNLISGNGHCGIRIQNAGTMSNTVSGNYIGTNISGDLTLPNYYDGVEIIGGATNTTVGGTIPGARNLISGNGEAGVWIEGVGTMSNTVSGNYIGTNISGTSALPNYYDGVMIIGGATNNTIGGTVPGTRNLISGNGEAGVWVEGVGTMNNTISGNYIGATISGSSALSNGELGVLIALGAANNTIGGTAPGARNLIDGSGQVGVKIQNAGTMSNTVLGNHIGADISGAVALPNYIGVAIIEGATNNIVGGDASGARNLISGNQDTGVWIQGVGTMSNIVLGNYIGANISGTVALSNYDGVYICCGATNNTIGGDTLKARNLISGNRRLGVFIHGAGTMSNAVLGNYIGTNISGASALGNANEGVVIGTGATNNTIGGDTPGARNLVSGNGLGGVRIEGTGTMSNTVMGNYIGTNVSGTVAVPNDGNGVFVFGATNNIVGGDTPGARNLISGNADTGVWLQVTGTMSNTVLGNYIGTDVFGIAALPNYGGVFIGFGATNNTIGGDTPGAGNLISGNEYFGVKIQDTGTTSNTVLGNSIGTTISGASALGNEEIGVLICFGATNNSIGGLAPGSRNLISGNGNAGVWIQNVGTMSNTVLGNYIGTNISGTVALANNDGVFIGFGATNNIIGGDTFGARNLISGNRGSGVWIQNAGTMGNAVVSNAIGTTISGDASLGNERDGVFIRSGATHNTIGVSNTIAYNALAGVAISDTTTLQNTATRNVIRDNGGLPIDLIGWPAPVSPSMPRLNGFSALDNTVWGDSCSGCRVEIFANPTSTPAGTIFLGDATADDNGRFGLALNGSPPYFYLAATATNLEGTTSKFSSGFRLAGSRLTPGSITVTVSSSGTIAYVHTLMNVGPGMDTFTLTRSSGHGWPVTLQPLQVTMENGVTATVTATLTVPAGLTGYVVDRLVITATSALNAQAVAVAQDITIFDNWFRVYLPVVIKKQ